MIFLKNKDELKSIDYACKIVRDTLFHLEDNICVDITPLDLDKMAEEFIISKGGIPGFKGLYGFPNTLCVSIDEEVVHGIPSKRCLKEGEIVSIDVGSVYNEFYGDHAKTFCIGNVTELKQKLVSTTKECLMLALSEVKPGNHVGDIGYAVQTYAEKNNFAIVRELVGHGIGKNLHEEPQIPNYGKKNTGPKLKEGMCLAIEPMVNVGARHIKTDSDGWTIRTKDGSSSAHFEHSILITKFQPRILT